MKRSYAQKYQIVYNAMVYTEIVWAPSIGWSTAEKLCKLGYKGLYAVAFRREGKRFRVSGRLLPENTVPMPRRKPKGSRL